jgi:hypothetical protein
VSVVRGPVLATLLIVTVALAGCKKKKESPEPPPAPLPVAGLAAIPADATVVVGLDMAALADSALIGSALGRMFEGAPGLATRFERLATDCGVDVTRQVTHVHLAMAPGGTGSARRALLIATGVLDEVGLSRCLQAGVGAGGGKVTVRTAGGRSLYQLVEGRHTVYFGFGQTDTVIVGPDQAWVEAALGDGPKVMDASMLSPYLRAVDQRQGLWFAATMDRELGAALVRSTEGKLTAAPIAVYASADVTDGFAARVTFAMPSADDATALAAFSRGELALGSMAAQVMGLGPVVAKIGVGVERDQVIFRANLTNSELKDVLTAVDSGGGHGQDAPPAADGGQISAPDAGSDAAL